MLEDCRRSFSEMIQEQHQARPIDGEPKIVAVQTDDLITFRQLAARSAGATTGEEDEYQTDLNLATGANEQEREGSSKLNRVTQLTGFSDPLYAEAYVNVHRYDIVLGMCSGARHKIQPVASSFALHMRTCELYLCD
jgi:coatomer subunit beta